MTLNVALIRGRYDPFGGAERFVQNAVEALAAQGARLTLITRKWPAHASADPGIAPLLVDPFYLGSLWRDQSFARAACEAVDRGNFDLVQSHERIACCDVYRAGDGVHAEWLAQRRRVQSPFKQLGVRLNPHHRYLLLAERELFRSERLKAVICNSHMVKDEILRHFATPAQKLCVIHNSVDSQQFHPGLKEQQRANTRKALRIAKSAPLFLFVGSGFERKGLIAFLMSLAELPGDCRGVVVGKDKRMMAFQMFADELGLSARVHFTGGVEDVRPYYAAADVFVLPTLYDPFPNACLEAMACGLPVVTSNKCGVAELIENGSNGRVCDALDTPRIAEAMQSCFAAAAQMGAAARQRVAALTPQHMAEQYLALYRTLLAPT